MACGTPVVALRRGSIPELVVDGVTGIVTDEAEELAGAIRRIDAIEPLACRSHVAGAFSAERMAADYEAVYDDVLANVPRQASRSGA